MSWTTWESDASGAVTLRDDSTGALMNYDGRRAIIEVEPEYLTEMCLRAGDAAPLIEAHLSRTRAPIT